MAAGLPLPTVIVPIDEIRNGKPDPEGFFHAAAHLGVAPAAPQKNFLTAFEWDVHTTVARSRCGFLQPITKTLYEAGLFLCALSRQTRFLPSSWCSC